MTKEQVLNDRIGFVTMVNTTQRNDGQAIYKSVKNEESTIQLFQEAGWRIWKKGEEPIEAREFNHETARVLEAQKAAKEIADTERLQSRIELVYENGGRPDIKMLKGMKESEFQAALQELREQEKEPTKVGRPKKSNSNVEGN